jgi:hypothetical protein
VTWPQVANTVLLEHFVPALSKEDELSPVYGVIPREWRFQTLSNISTLNAWHSETER